MQKRSISAFLSDGGSPAHQAGRRASGIGVTICTGGMNVPCYILQATRAAVSDCLSPVRTGASAPEGSTPPPTPPASRPAEREPASTQHRVSFDVGGASYDHLGLKGEAEVVRAFYQALERSADVAVAVAAIKALTSVVTKSSATTLMGLEQEVKEAALSLQRCNPTAISLKAGCELFLRYTTRTSLLDVQDFGDAKARIIERGNHFAETSTQARHTIAELGGRFIRPGARVLCHGHSRVCLALLRRAAASGTQFSVVVTEGRPDGTGLLVARTLEEQGIPVTLVLDSAVAYIMERIDMVLVGAEGVVESGGVINKLGTLMLAVCAKNFNKPFYVAAESYKFARLFPLDQQDLQMEQKHIDFGPLLPPATRVLNPSRDYTPPSFISLLFTDLGVLTPAAVSDELIQLYL